MRVFIIVLVLVFSLQSWTKADDLKDFQIEGMSIGDSVLDLFTKDYIKKRSKFVVRGGKKFEEYSKILIKKDLSNYDSIFIYFKTNDKKFIIKSIAGRKFYSDNLSECYDQQKKIANQIEDNILNTKGRYYPKEKVRAFPEGDSYLTQIWFDAVGGHIGIQCYDYSSKDTTTRDRLSLVIFSLEYNSWLSSHKF